MGIFGALNTAVTGLRAQSYALENISGNIANSQTTGFKRIDTSFMDLIPDTGSRMQLAGSVLASARATNSVQGDIQNASVGTFMAINGDGFFVVQKPSGLADNNPLFDGSNLFTRRGDFVPDKNGYLVNGAGYYLMGVPIDPVSGNPMGSVPQVLQFQNDFLPASSTTGIEYRANLPRVPATQAYDANLPGSELINPTAFTANPLAGGTGTVIGTDINAFMQQTISGGAITAFDASGNSVNLQLRWAKTDSASRTTAGAFTATNAFAATTVGAGESISFNVAVDGGAPVPVVINEAAVLAVGNGNNVIDTPEEFEELLANAGVTGVSVSLEGGNLTLTSGSTGANSSVVVSGYTPAGGVTDDTGIGAGASVAGEVGTDTWELFYQENATAAGTDVAWRNAGQVYTFGPNMQMNPPVANVMLNNVIVNGIEMGDINIAHGSGGITQFADANGRVQVNMIEQNGYPAGELIGISVSDKGRLTGLYSNGRTVDIAEITLANFNGPDMLRRIDGGAFAVTDGSGPPIYGAAGQVLSAALEGSNTDIADEFTKLIVTQQAYSANTRVVTTTNEMVRDLLNMLR